MAQKISRVSVWNIRRAFKKFGNDALKDRTCGRPVEQLNPRFCKIVVKNWQEQRCGARKLHVILRRKGYGVSLRKISKVMVANGFQKPCIKRRKPRKYRRYEWPLPNLMWHTDWYELDDGQWLIPYIDDCTRRIMSCGVFEHSTTRNALTVLYKAIADNGVVPLYLNSDRGTQFYANTRDKKGNAKHEFEQALEMLGIDFRPSRPRHPQTNGKNERWNGIVAREYDDRFRSIDHFVRWYNSKRVSEAIDYQTPDDKYRRMTK